MTGDVEETAKKILEKEGKEIKDYYEGYVDQLHSEFYKDYVEHDGKLYKVEKEELDLLDDIFEAEEFGDCFNFEVKYYNGGCGFHEAIELALKKLKEKNNE